MFLSRRHGRVTISSSSPCLAVMQTYKTGMCFLTSWIVLLLGKSLVVSFVAFMSTRITHLLIFQRRTANLYTMGSLIGFILGSRRHSRYSCCTDSWIGCITRNVVYVENHGACMIARGIIVVYNSIQAYCAIRHRWPLFGEFSFLMSVYGLESTLQVRFCS